MIETYQVIKKHGKFIFAMLLFLAITTLGAASFSKSKVLDKISTFQVEIGSILRSETLRPEKASPVVTPDGILVASSRQQLKVFSKNGKTIREFKLEFRPTATPAVGDGKVFVGGNDGKFHCLELETGKELWASDLKSIDFSQPALFPGLVIFQTASDRLIAMDAATGLWKWEYQHLRGEDLAIAGMCPPLVVDDTVYFGLSAGFVMAVDAASGRPLWKVRPFTGVKFRDVDAPMAADAENVFAASVGGGMVALSRKTGKVIWRTAAGGLGGMRIKDGVVYLASEEPAVTAFDAASGKQLWSTKLKEKRVRYSDYPLAPVAVKKIIVVVTRGGKLFALSAADGKVEQTEYYLTRTANSPVELPGDEFMVLDNQGLIRVWRALGD